MISFDSMKQNWTEIIRAPSGEVLQYLKEEKNEFLQTPTGKKYPIYDNIICFLDNISLTGNNKIY
jgi:hypothetical protein